MRVEVRDHALWIKHIEGAEPTLDWLLAIPGGETVRLVVDDVDGEWRKMKDGKDGRPTPGFMPVSEAAKTRWHALQNQRGSWVPLLAHASD
jgi:hypothetical protein